MSEKNDYAAIVVGAGPAGLAVSRELSRHGVDHLVLERGAIGESWSHMYDSLTLHTGKHLSSLPGLPFGLADPLFVPRQVFLAYLHRYQATFQLPVRTGLEVTAARRDGERWIVETSAGAITARMLVVTTGFVSNPVIPTFPGQSEFRGLVRHSSMYRRSEECRGRRVLVVGAGNSAGEIASELGRAGVDTTIAVRSGANVVPLQLLGVPIQYLSYLTRSLPRPLQELLVRTMNRIVDFWKGPPVIPRGSRNALDDVPMIGFRLSDGIRRGEVKLRGGIDRLTVGGVVFAGGKEEPFEEIILATGYRPALGFLGSLITCDDRGFASRRDRVLSADQPDLFYVGQNTDATGVLFNIRGDTARAARAVKAALSRK